MKIFVLTEETDNTKDVISARSSKEVALKQMEAQKVSAMQFEPFNHASAEELEIKESASSVMVTHKKTGRFFKIEITPIILM